MVRDPTSGITTGIELTVFHLPPDAGSRPHQEVQSLKNRVVALASQRHALRGGPALCVSVFFRPNEKLTKGSTHDLVDCTNH